jgi:hypothetical protein
MPKKQRFGNLPPRYSLLLNPYIDVRVSKCPKCDRPTHPRKFALFVVVKDQAPIILGMTCPYCTPCELVVIHEVELQAELAQPLALLPPRERRKQYLVVGTVDKKVWRQGMAGSGTPFDEVLDHLADFKKTYDLKVEGGWGPARR